ARDGEPTEKQFKLPGKALIPILSLTVIFWMLSQLSLEEALGLAALVGASILIYIIMQVTKVKNNAD
ncbi:MAG: hypothetical protein HN572_06260, partial [Kordiimonadaceae bacterium]|nr:hypothetical protein [Kordiimonadaceae bacterium]